WGLLGYLRREQLERAVEWRIFRRRELRLFDPIAITATAGCEQRSRGEGQGEGSQQGGRIEVFHVSVSMEFEGILMQHTQAYATGHPPHSPPRHPGFPSPPATGERGPQCRPCPLTIQQKMHNHMQECTCERVSPSTSSSGRWTLEVSEDLVLPPGTYTVRAKNA